MLNLPVGSYLIPDTGDLNPDRIERVNDEHGGLAWAVRSNGMCLSRAMEWDREPMPSSSLRTVEWYHQHRFLSAEEAYTHWQRWQRRVADDGR